MPQFRPILDIMGYVDYVNALAPGKRNRFTPLFIKIDENGVMTGVHADSRQVAAMYRAASPRPPQVKPDLRYDFNRHIYIVTAPDGTITEYENLTDAMWAVEHPGEDRLSLWDVAARLADARKNTAGSARAGGWNHRSPITGHFTGGDRS